MIHLPPLVRRTRPATRPSSRRAVSQPVARWSSGAFVIGACFGGALLALLALPVGALANPSQSAPAAPPPASAAAPATAQPTPPATPAAQRGQPAAPATAAQPAAPAVTPASQAAAFEAAGRQAYAAAQYQRAHDAFGRAFSHVPKASYLYNMARCLEKLAKYSEAVKALKRYLSHYKHQHGGQSPANATDVQNLIRTLRQRAYDALPEVVIGTNPSGATVALLPGGRILGSTPLVTHLKPGTYKLKMQLAKHTPLEADLLVPETGKVRAVFSLKPIVRLAGLSFWCNVRGAKVAVDGKVVAITPYSGTLEITPGRHQISIQKPGYAPIEEIVKIPENQELHINYVLELVNASSSWRSVLGWPLLVGGLGGIGGGYWARMQADEQYAGTPKFKLFEGYQNLGYGGGGAAVAVGLGLIVWDGVRSGIPDEDRVVGAKRVKGKTLRPMRSRKARGR